MTVNYNKSRIILMKYKNLTKEQIIISLDRLTRFKNTKEKYLRVFSDILTTSLINPKYKKNDIINLDYKILSDLVSEILNSSIKLLTNSDSSKTSINKFLQNYENHIFINDEETQALLKNNIDYTNASELIDENSPINLKWLKTLLENTDEPTFELLREIRAKYLLKFPVEKVILVEGITEEILLPAFSKFLDYDFYAHGIQIIAAGGKNQVVKMYYKLSQEIKLPIFILLDKDAEENINQIKPKLRNIDKIHLVSCGEFEDLLPKSLIVKTVNSLFKNFVTISELDLISTYPTAHVLEELFRIKGLHEFKKSEFAYNVRENINDKSDISTEIETIIKEITSSY
jgi:hypothetical protein